MIKNILKKKQSGNGDMIACFFIILGLSTILLISVSFIKDMFNIINLDQIARQGILLVETEGKLLSEDQEYIKKLLIDAGADEDSIIVEVLDRNNKVVPLNKTVGYGNMITLHIKCKLPRTTFKDFKLVTAIAEGDGGFTERYKSSIAKY